MKIRQRRSRRVLPFVLLALGLALLAAAGWYWFDNNVDRSGWINDDGTYYYRDFHGKKVTGWQQIDEKYYYFCEDKVMQTHWLELDGDRYFFGRDGALDIGWLDIDGKTYYSSPRGVIQTGWQEIDENRYYLDEEGVLQTGWLEQEGETYYLGDDGAVVYGWQDIDSCTYFFEPDGTMLTGKTTIADNHYYFLENGAMYTGWEDTEEGRYYYGEDGSMAFGWAEVDGKRYHLDENGIMQTGWLEQGEYRYYLQEDGSAAVGPLELDGETYYFTPKGIHVVLVNAKNYVPDYYDVNLVTFTEHHKVAEICLEPLQRMLEDCVAAGNEYTFNSAYRTIANQTLILETRTQEHMERYELTFEEARAKALQTVAVPGTSEHHLGLAVDILGEDAIAWLGEHCWEYGFIVRYTEEKSSITGIVNEPWHFRYVGTEISMELKDSGLCLEEYLGAEPVYGTTDSSAASE